MNTQPTDKLSAWRADMDAAMAKAHAAEAWARSKGLPEGFGVRWTWSVVPSQAAALDWCEWDAPLSKFTSMVRAVMLCIGPADKVKGEHWVASADRVPDLIARWTIKEPSIEVTVRVLSPKGCKIDPRTGKPEGIPDYEPAKLHPECAAVLAELDGVA